jgi:peptide/nickel transport system ATP-binding protein
MITAPRHPYTRMLIESLPGIDAKRRLTGIPGLPPWPDRHAARLRPRLTVADEPVSMVDASLRATILNEIRDVGIAFVYITHDLTTAFQLCDDIALLYQGRLAKAGAVEHVIGAPKRPYSQLLVSYIPLPDLSRRWGDDDLQADPAQAARWSQGCQFAPRCHRVTDRCWKQNPALTRPLPHRLLSCNLNSSPTLPNKDIATVFSGPSRRANEGELP